MPERTDHAQVLCCPERGSAVGGRNVGGQVLAKTATLGLWAFCGSVTTSSFLLFCFF